MKIMIVEYWYCHVNLWSKKIIQWYLKWRCLNSNPCCYEVCFKIKICEEILMIYMIKILLFWYENFVLSLASMNEEENSRFLKVFFIDLFQIYSYLWFYMQISKIHEIEILSHLIG